jgi:hypothetical protein
LSRTSRKVKKAQFFYLAWSIRQPRRAQFGPLPRAIVVHNDGIGVPALTLPLTLHSLSKLKNTA